jgi:hypothetical protein
MQIDERCIQSQWVCGMENDDVDIVQYQQMLDLAHLCARMHVCLRLWNRVELDVGKASHISD